MWIYYFIFPQVYAVLPFNTQWTLPCPSTVQLSFMTNVSLSIAWGDGNTAVSTSTNISHTYTTCGRIDISISGNVTGFQCNGNCVGLTSIDQWGAFTITPNQINIFSGASDLISIRANDQPIVLPGASFEGMFANCGQLVGDITLNTTGVVSMKRMFQGAYSFNGNLIFSDTSNVTDFSSIFEDAGSFQSLSMLNTRNAKNMSHMFAGASQFNSDISFFNTSLVTDMSFMFMNAYTYNNNNKTLSLSTKRVTNMDSMFLGASSFQQLISFDISSVTNMNSMFANNLYFSSNLLSWNVSQVNICSSFCVSCGLPNFTQCEPCESGAVLLKSVRNYSVCYCPMNETISQTDQQQCVDLSCPVPQSTGQPGNCSCANGYFGHPYPASGSIQGCDPIQCPPSNPDYKSTNREIPCQCYRGSVQYSGNTASGCSPIGTFRSVWMTTMANERLVLPFDIEFAGPCNITVDWGDKSSPQLIYSDQDPCSASWTFRDPGKYVISITGIVKSFSCAFHDCSQLYGILEWGGFIVDQHSSSAFSGCLHLGLNATDQPIIEYGACMDYFFSNASLIVPQPISWDLSGVVTMTNMFAHNPSFNVAVKLLTPDVTDMSGMFSYCPLLDQPITFPSPMPNLIYTNNMFQNATSFNSKITMDTSSVRDMSAMFRYALAYNQPITFDTSTAYNMAYMFSYAIKFNQTIDLNATSLTDAMAMFAYAQSFNSPVMLRDSYQLKGMECMFCNAVTYNQPTRFTISNLLLSVDMSWMFANAISFNSEVTFNNATATYQTSMFENATSFNQPITFPLAAGDRSYMFRGATKFTQRIVAADFSITCTSFCPYCILPPQISDVVAYCHPCDGALFWNRNNDTMCNCQPGLAVLNPVARNDSQYCDAIPCPAGDSAYQVQNGTCVCGPGTSGTAVYGANNVSGCVLIPCPPILYESQNGVCVCSAQAEGQAVYNGLIVSGCVSKTSSNVTIPFSSSANTTSVNVSGVRVVVRPDPVWGDNGTLTVAVKPPSNATVSQIVDINFFDSSKNRKNISGLSSPVQFFIPLEPGAATPFQACVGELPAAVVPACNWFDPIDSTWKTSGCVTNLSTTQVECTCTHLTDFAAVLPKSNPIPINQALALTADNIALNPGGIITVGTVLGLFVLVTMMAVYRDKFEKKMEEELQAKKFDKWTKAAESQVQIDFKTRWCKQFKDGLQLRHTWGSLFFRKSGTTFRSVDRACVCLFMVLVLMCMSASFHDRNQSFVGRAEVTVLNILVSLPPGLVLTHLFTHTGELGFYEKWQMQKGMIQPSKFKCLRYRFSERWRYVWYALVLIAVIGMIIYILSIALMFDQNPDYYCRGKTTLAWIIDFIIPYAISICVVEPVKIMLFLTSKKFLQDQRVKARLREETAGNGELDSAESAEMRTFPDTASESPTP